ncbi:MAG: GntR family transcriptional regulator [Brevundimonas sp.]|nr:GntR family transcriptional regulator [Brevundimonas sp.]
MRSRDPYHDALTALAAFAGSGRFGWGEPLVATALAAELDLSQTPVREALARLAGEGLIEHRPGRGYYAPSPGADDIADLYELHRRLAHWAIDLLETSGPAGPLPGAGEGGVERFFTELARAPGRAVLAQAHWRLTLRLRPIRRVEADLAPMDAGWIAGVESQVAEGAFTALRQEVDLHHQERSAMATAVVSVMRQSVESIGQI